jgi:tetratricopeptide (TPR) repeat protein
MLSNWVFAAAGIGLAMSCSPAMASDRSDRIACTQANGPEAKIAACTRLLESGKLSNKERSNAYQARGLFLREKGERDRAIADFNEAIRLDPNDPDAYNARSGSWLLDMGDVDRALSDLNESIAHAPQNADSAIFYGNRGNVWLEQKRDFDRAIVDYTHAIRLDPENSSAHLNRGVAWKELGQFDRAITDYTAAIRLSPRSETAYAKRGESWRLKGDLDRALADQDRAVAINPKGYDAYLLRGDTHRYKGDFADAIADYQRAIELSPRDVPALTGLGLTFERMGDLTNARVKFEQACASGLVDRRLILLYPTLLDTCRARLAALNSGVAQPTIPISLPKATSATSIPTPTAAIPVSPVTAVAARGRRVALVIGNSAYKSVPVLVNPLHDADAIVGSLKAIGFAAVTLIKDGTREALIEALRKFAEDAEDADWAVIYYAGHGMEMNGANYLIPVDARLATDRDLQFEAVPLDQLLTSVEGARKLKLILLDACRDNPFAPTMRRTATPEIVATARPPGATMGMRSIGRGLGEVKVSAGTLVVFAAKNGQTALDGEGWNSPFAIAVTQRIATPDVEITKVFRLVRDDVMEATAGRQEPYTYGSLPGNEDFLFVAK